MGLRVLRLPRDRVWEKTQRLTPTRSARRRGRAADGASSTRLRRLLARRATTPVPDALPRADALRQRATRFGRVHAGRDRGRPPRLLHVEPRAPRRRGDRRAAAVVQHDEVAAGRRAARTPTSCSRPGPGHPADAGRLRGRPRGAARRHAPGARASASGMQGLVTAYGGTVDRRRAGARRGGARHATTGAGVFAGLPQDFAAVRYHSLAAVVAARRARRDGVERGRRGDGRAPPRRCRSRACSSTPSRSCPSTAPRWSRTSWARDR